MSGALCCDSCGTSGGVRKIKCPHGWCPSRAMCAACRAKYTKAMRDENHKTCAASAKRASDAEDEMRAHCAAGIPVLWSCDRVDSNTVKAIFRDTPAFIRAGEVFKEAKLTYYMIPMAIYNQRQNMRGYPIPDDFAALGKIELVGA